jgi:RNA polymerase sigma factor (TIGR02999 family)
MLLTRQRLPARRPQLYDDVCLINPPPGTAEHAGVGVHGDDRGTFQALASRDGSEPSANPDGPSGIRSPRSWIRNGRRRILTVAMSDVTRILQRIETGDPSAAEQLLPLVYDELRKLAAARMAREAPGHTLQPTELVHEAYLRLMGGESAPQWDSRGHFFAAAAEAMRRILVDSARRKSSLKRGEGHTRVDLTQVSDSKEVSPIDLIALDEALYQLEQHDPQAAALVKLRYFAGLSHTDAAAALRISRRAADRLWSLARAWLFRQLAESDR